MMRGWCPNPLLGNPDGLEEWKPEPAKPEEPKPVWPNSVWPYSGGILDIPADAKE